MSHDRVAVLAGGYSLALVLGALWFQYFGGVLPCEVCMWQRYPHDAALAIGLGGALFYYTKVIDMEAMKVLAWLALACILIAGVLGVYHSLVEWKYIAGPSSCTGPRFVLTPDMNLNAPVIRCDEPSWYLFGLTLANYNAIFSLGMAALGTLLLTRKIVVPFKWLQD